MNLLHYFFGSDKQRAKFIFNFIAPLYGKIDNSIQDGYAKICGKLDKQIPLENYSTLDVGTGTGSWLSSISKYSNKKSLGIDFSEKMILQARKNHPELEFIKLDAENMAQIKDNSFDIVTASFVLHGMKAKERSIMLKEMQRIGRKYIMIHDFRNKTALFVQILEFLERSDYKFFKINFENEMKEHFDVSDILDCDNGNAIYIGEIA